MDPITVSENSGIVVNSLSSVHQLEIEAVSLFSLKGGGQDEDLPVGDILIDSAFFNRLNRVIKNTNHMLRGGGSRKVPLRLEITPVVQSDSLEYGNSTSKSIIAKSTKHTAQTNPTAADSPSVETTNTASDDTNDSSESISDISSDSSSSISVLQQGGNKAKRKPKFDSGYYILSEDSLFTVSG